MPRPAKGARLYLKRRPGREPTYIIRQSGYADAYTGTSDQRQAEEILATTIISRRSQIQGGGYTADEMTIDDVLTFYGEEHAPHVADPARIGYAMDALLSWWSGKKVSAVTASTCRRYTIDRNVSPGTVRRELGVLRAAMEYCAAEGILVSAPKVTLPPRPERKERWLTRQEVYWLLRGARSLRSDGRHVAKFVLASLYTASRTAATLSLAIDMPTTNGGHIDTKQGLIYRLPRDASETKKRKGTARLPRNFLAHVRRWKKNGANFVVQDKDGARVASVRRSFASACRSGTKLARKKGVDIDLSDVSPHVLKHTSITWLLQSGAKMWDVASFSSTSIQTLERDYAHHHPDHQRTAVEALEKAN